MRCVITKASVHMIHGLCDSLRFTTDPLGLKKSVVSKVLCKGRMKLSLFKSISLIFSFDLSVCFYSSRWKIF